MSFLLENVVPLALKFFQSGGFSGLLPSSSPSSSSKPSKPASKPANIDRNEIVPAVVS